MNTALVTDGACKIFQPFPTPGNPQSWLDLTPTASADIGNEGTFFTNSTDPLVEVQWGWGWGWGWALYTVALQLPPLPTEKEEKGNEEEKERREEERKGMKWRPSLHSNESSGG